MLITDVIAVLDALDSAAVRHWVAGGWGVDCLVGDQTREHRDLDLAVDAADCDRCMAVLEALGYEIETDWRPLRIEVRAAGEDRWVDVHPVLFDTTGWGIQGEREGTHFAYSPAAFTQGRLGDRRVACLSVGQQTLFHSGYALTDKDRHDLALLARLAHNHRDLS